MVTCEPAYSYWQAQLDFLAGERGVYLQLRAILLCARCIGKFITTTEVTCAETLSGLFLLNFSILYSVTVGQILYCPKQPVSKQVSVIEANVTALSSGHKGKLVPRCYVVYNRSTLLVRCQKGPYLGHPRVLLLPEGAGELSLRRRVTFELLPLEVVSLRRLNAVWKRTPAKNTPLPVIPSRSSRLPHRHT